MSESLVTLLLVARTLLGPFLEQAAELPPKRRRFGTADPGLAIWPRTVLAALLSSPLPFSGGSFHATDGAFLGWIERRLA